MWQCGHDTDGRVDVCIGERGAVLLLLVCCVSDGQPVVRAVRDSHMDGGGIWGSSM